MPNNWGLETRLVHAGADPDPTTGARVTPIYQTTSFVFRDTEHAAALFGLQDAANGHSPAHASDPRESGGS